MAQTQFLKSLNKPAASSALLPYLFDQNPSELHQELLDSSFLFFSSESPLFTCLSTYLMSQTEHQWARSALFALYHENPIFKDSSWLQILHSARSNFELLCLALNNEDLDDPKPHQA